MSKRPGRRDDKPAQRPERRSGAEWTAFGISAAILLAVVGAIGYFWLTQDAGEPRLEISQAGEIQQRGRQFYVPFEVRNLGGAAANIQLEAELASGGEPEPASQQIDFLAGGEIERGAFLFDADPRQGELTLRVASYLDP